MRNIVLIIIGFVLYYLGFKRFETIMLLVDKYIHFRLASYGLTYVIIALPLFAVTCIVNRDLSFPRHLGLQSGILRGMAIGIIFTLPMLIGGVFQYGLTDNISVPNMIAKAVFDPFFEELVFRGYFFGLLFRNTKLGFIPSILVCSLIFASGHLYQSQDPVTLLGIFTTTFLGSILFAWLYVEWNYNLWVPIFTHLLMNLCWHIFSVSDNALGTMSANIFRGLTIALSIILTLTFKKRRGEKLLINNSTLITKKNYR